MPNISRTKTWSSEETLTASDLNAEFNGILSGTNDNSLDQDNLSKTDDYTMATLILGSGISAADGQLHVHLASAGTIAANTSYNDIVVENNGAAGLTFLTPNNAAAGIVWGDPDDNDIGSILYDHSANDVSFTVGATADVLVMSSSLATLKAGLTVGVNDAGHDVTLYGDTDGARLTWDTSADKLLTVGGAVIDIVKDKLLIGGTAVTTTAAELNVLDAVTAGTVAASKGVVVDANKDIASFRNLTLTGELDAGSLDVSGNADIDGTLEADAYTVDGTALNEYIADTIGAMVTSTNTETGITVAYQDADNTLDFTIGTLNQDTTGTAAIATTVTITDNESTNENNALIFTAGGDVDGGNLGLESDGTLTYNPSTGKITATGFIGALTGDVTGDVTGNVSGTAGVATTVTITDNESTNEDNAIVFTAGGDVDGGNLGLESDGTLTYNPSTGSVTATGFIGALTGNASTATALASARTIGGVSFDGTGNINLPGVNTAGNQNTSGTAAVATAVTITDNESTNETNAIVFTSGGDVDGGNLGLESDGDLTYNPSSGLLSATAVTATGAVNTGALTSTGNISFDGGSFVFNESGADKDFRIEGDTNANLFVADASEDKIGFGTATPGPGLVTMGGGVAATTVRIDIDGGSDNGKGAQLAFRSGSTDKFYIGDTASLQGGSESSRDMSLYTTSGCGIRFYTGGNNRRMTVDSSGNVGIAMVPGGSHKLDVTGSAGLSTGTAWTNTSDARIKTSVATITGATAKIKQLRPVSFKYTADYLSVHPEIDGSKTYHSFIADEYETVFPDAVSVQGDLVRITPAAEGRAEERETLLSDLKQFTPHDLQMFLAAAIQELDTRITALEAE